MLTLLINSSIGLVAAVTLASLAHSLRAFLPTYSRLRADLNACDNQRTIRVTIREASAPAAEAMVYRPAFSSHAIKPPALTLRPCLRAAA